MPMPYQGFGPYESENSGVHRVKIHKLYVKDMVGMKTHHAQG